MDIWLIYRICKNLNTGKVERIEPVEYCASGDEAAKYTRLFDLQRPIDLKDKISYKNYATYVQED